MAISESSASELASFLLEDTPPVHVRKSAQKKSSKKKPTSESRKAVKSVIKQVNSISITDKDLIDDDFFNSMYDSSSEEPQTPKSGFSKKKNKASKGSKNNKKVDTSANETLTEAEAFDQLDEIKVEKKEKKEKKPKKEKSQPIEIPQITDTKMAQLDEELALLSKQTLSMYSKQMDIKAKLIDEIGTSEGNLQSAFAVLHDYIESFVEYYDSICDAINISDDNGFLAECVSKRMEILVLSKRANILNKEKKFMVNNSKIQTPTNEPKQRNGKNRKGNNKSKSGDKPKSKAKSKSKSKSKSKDN